jgi:hypothetical protein
MTVALWTFIHATDNKRKQKRGKKRELSLQTLEDFRIGDVIGDLVDIGFVDQYGNIMDIGCPRKCHI